MDMNIPFVMCVWMGLVGVVIVPAFIVFLFSYQINHWAERSDHLLQVHTVSDRKVELLCVELTFVWLDIMNWFTFMMVCYSVM